MTTTPPVGAVGPVASDLAAGMAGMLGIGGGEIAQFARKLSEVNARATMIAGAVEEAVRACPSGEGFMALGILQGFQGEIERTLVALRCLEAARRAATETAGRYGGTALQAIEQRTAALGALGADLRAALGPIAPPKEGKK